MNLPFTGITIGIPLWGLAAAGALFLLSVLSGGWILVQSNLLRSRLQVLRDRPERWREEYRKFYPPGRLVRFSGVLERYAERRDEPILELTGVDEIWIRRLAVRGTVRDMRRVLRLIPDRGLFVCFLASLRKPRLARILTVWLREQRDYHGLRRLAMAGRGGLFEGGPALEMLREHLPELRDMTDDPEWSCRAFALQILLHDDGDAESVRASWEAFSDSAAPIRRIAVREMRPDDQDRLFATLSRMILDDPNEDVRREAHRRLLLEFRDRYSPTEEPLDDIRTLHLLSLLAPGVEKDEAFAFRFLEDPDLEKRFLAAVYLQKNGSLDQLFSRIQEGEREGVDRALRLLSCAAEVNVCGFLTVLVETENRGALTVGAHILRERGDRSLIAVLAERVFARPHCESADLDLYKEVLATIRERGAEDAYRILAREIACRRDDRNLIPLLLEAVPPESSHLFSGLLLELFVDPGFPAPDDLEKLLRTVPRGMIMDRVYRIVVSTGDAYPRTVRVRALRLLAGFGADFCTQHVLENLPLCGPKEAVQITAFLDAVGDGKLDEKIRYLLDSDDAAVRAALMRALPLASKRRYLDDIRRALRDADPDVRIAAVRTLIEAGDALSVERAADLLRDPVERVRIEAARAVGRYGSDEALEALVRVVEDGSEVRPVREAAVDGLGESKSIRAVDILIDRLEAGDSPEESITEALSRKRERAELVRMLVRYEAAGTDIRKSIGRVFRKMGSAGETALVALLREDGTARAPCIADVLEAAGYVDDRIHKLSHRNPAVRRESAEILSRVESLAALRGIVMAARDPDDEVRAVVTPVLEKLAGDKSRQLLRELERDPDRRVRKYALWAMKRVRTKTP